MHHRPIIIIPCRRWNTDSGEEGEHFGVIRSYVDALASAGATTLLLPVQDQDSVVNIFNSADGLMLAGGEDVGEEGTVRSCDEIRDRFERLMVQLAFKKKIPMLGICRGMQLINIARGGTTMLVEGASRRGVVHHQTDWQSGHLFGHWVNISQGTRLSEILGAEQIPVNGVHSRCVDAIGHGLRASAYSDDGLIEAIETYDDSFCIGVQWHPEALACANDQPAISLFKKFVEQCQWNPAGNTKRKVKT